MSSFGYIPLYILAVGGFYGVLYKTNGYRNLLDKIVDKYSGNEWIFLTIIMILFAVITSVAGLSLGLFFMFPFVIRSGYSEAGNIKIAYEILRSRSHCYASSCLCDISSFAFEL